MVRLIESIIDTPVVIARIGSDEAIQTFRAILDCFAGLSSGALSRDPLARNDGNYDAASFCG
jgi:hypothetical protein